MTDEKLKGYVDPISKDDLLDEYAARIAELEAALKQIIDVDDSAIVDHVETAIRWDEAIDAARAALEKKDG